MDIFYHMICVEQKYAFHLHKTTLVKLFPLKLITWPCDKYIWIPRTCNFREISISLLWCHNGCDGVSNHQLHDCLLNRLFRCKSKKTSKLRVTGLCAGNSPVTGEFPAQMNSNAKSVSIWWRHHAKCFDMRVAEPGTNHNSIKSDMKLIKRLSYSAILWTLLQQTRDIARMTTVKPRSKLELIKYGVSDA